MALGLYSGALGGFCKDRIGMQESNVLAEPRSSPRPDHRSHLMIDFGAVNDAGVLECPCQIYIEHKLDVIGKDVIIAPGCEPTSALTSTTLARWNECGGATVNLAEALEAIPGSYIRYQINNGESNGVRKRWFVLPAYCPICEPGCTSMPDYHQILRDLAKQEDEDEPEYAECEVLDQGFCKDPSRQEPVIVRPDPYKQEGNLFGITPQLFNTPRDFSHPNLRYPGNDPSDPYIG